MTADYVTILIDDANDRAQALARIVERMTGRSVTHVIMTHDAERDIEATHPPGRDINAPPRGAVDGSFPGVGRAWAIRTPTCL